MPYLFVLVHSKHILDVKNYVKAINDIFSEQKNFMDCADTLNLYPFESILFVCGCKNLFFQSVVSVNCTNILYLLACQKEGSFSIKLKIYANSLHSIALEMF